MDNTTNTKPNEKVLRWAYINCTPVSKTSSITYLGLGKGIGLELQSVFGLGLGLGLLLGFFVKASSSDFNQAPIYP